MSMYWDYRGYRIHPLMMIGLNRSSALFTWSEHPETYDAHGTRHGYGGSAESVADAKAQIDAVVDRQS